MCTFRSSVFKRYMISEKNIHTSKSFHVNGTHILPVLCCNYILCPQKYMWRKKGFARATLIEQVYIEFQSWTLYHFIHKGNCCQVFTLFKFMDQFTNYCSKTLNYCSKMLTSMQMHFLSFDIDSQLQHSNTHLSGEQRSLYIKCLFFTSNVVDSFRM